MLADESIFLSTDSRSSTRNNPQGFLISLVPRWDGYDDFDGLMTTHYFSTHFRGDQSHKSDVGCGECDDPT